MRRARALVEKDRRNYESAVILDRAAEQQTKR